MRKSTDRKIGGMNVYNVRFDIPLKFVIEVEALNEELAVYEAIAKFWDDTLGYVDIDPNDAEVEEVGV